MLDCPAATQTSPTMTSHSTMRLPPSTVNSNGPPASPGGSVTDQRPSSSARVLRVAPRNDAVTASPGAAQPHTATGSPRWITM